MTNPIRALRREDLSRVGHLVEVNGMFPADMLDTMTAPYFDGETATHRWLVYAGAKVTGVAYFVPEQLTEGTWNLLLIAIDPACHGQGQGTAIMRHVEEELTRESQRILLVETSGTDTFERTRRFYDMLGYEREARIRDYYTDGDDKVIFRKALARWR